MSSKEVSILWVPLSCDLVGCRPPVRTCLFKSFRKPFFQASQTCSGKNDAGCTFTFSYRMNTTGRPWSNKMIRNMNLRNFIKLFSRNMSFSRFISWIHHRIRALDSFAHKAGRVSTVPWPCHASRVGVELTRTSSTATVLHDNYYVLFVCLLLELCQLLQVILIMLYCSSSTVEGKYKVACLLWVFYDAL